MKHLLSILLALLLCGAVLPAAYADTIYTEGDFAYTVNDGSVTITGYFGDETEVTIPAMIAGNPVNAIADNAFAGTDVTRLILPDTIAAGPKDVAVSYAADDTTAPSETASATQPLQSEAVEAPTVSTEPVASEAIAVEDAVEVPLPPVLATEAQKAKTPAAVTQDVAPKSTQSSDWVTPAVIMAAVMPLGLILWLAKRRSS